MSLNQNKIQNFINKNNNFKRNSFDSKLSLKLNNKNKSNNESKIFDITYKLFSNQYKNIKDGIKIKKIMAIHKSQEKHRYNTVKKKNNHSKKNRTNSELIDNNEINRVNSIIININNSQFNKTNIKHNSSFRNMTNSQMNEQYFSNSTNTKNHKNDYFYDFSTNKKKLKDKSNYFNSYNTNTYNIKSKNYNFHKIEHKLKKNDKNNNKNRSNEKINFKIYQKNPIKIKTNLISNKVKNKIYIMKKHNSDKTFNNISINNYIKSNNNINNEIKKLKKFLSSECLNNEYKISNTSNINKLNFNLSQKSAEKNYLQKWQFYIGENLRKKRSLSQMNSNKNYNMLQENSGVFAKNNIFTHRQDKNLKSLYYLNNTKNSINHIDKDGIDGKSENTDAYNYTENNQEYNNKIIDDFLLETIQKDKMKKQYETEKKMLNSNDNKVLNPNNFHTNYFKEKEKNLENYKVKEYDSINKIIERKKREIDLLSVMKFTSEIYFSSSSNNESKINNNNNKNMNYFKNKDFFENNKYFIINENDISDKNLYCKNNNNSFNINQFDNNRILLDKNDNNIIDDFF